MSILDKIVNQKEQEVGRLKRENDVADMKRKAYRATDCRDLCQALRNCPHAPVIAEIKRSSPSEGSIREVGDVAVLASMYRKGGASALSVLTDEPFFGGRPVDLENARSAVDLPVLRKDFIIDSVQLYESRIMGADAVLLIAAALEASVLCDLFHEAKELGMTPLVEVHSAEELERVLKLDPDIVGVNNRNLKTFAVNLETCVELRRMIPPETIVVGESGIREPKDIAMLRRAGIDAFLIGTSLMKSPDPALTLKTLCAAGVQP
jgi:indole-3-glycerol phosphate synthase